jgi:hypothetical protein
LKILTMLLLASGGLKSAEIPAGTILEIRLLTSVSSHDARRGDPVRGITVVPVRDANGVLLLPVGTIIQGRVERARRVGLGLVHETASLRLRLNEILTEHQGQLPLAARLVSVDNARERVDTKGTVRGIRATGSMAHRLHRRAFSLVNWHPLAGISASVASNVLFKFPEPEIQYPAGTELHTKLESPLMIEPVAETPDQARDLTTAEGTAFAEAIAGMPEWTHRPLATKPVDPTNLLFVGDRERLERAFAAAGWVSADPITGRSRFQVVRAVVEAGAYSDAPMSPMQLAGRDPDLVRQRGLNTFAKRHHVRIWRQERTAEGEDVWLGAATHDTNVGPTFKPLGFSHHIDGQVDLERQKVLHDLILTGCVAAHGIVDRATPGEAQARATRHISTDEAVVVVRLNECLAPLPMPVDNVLAPVTKPNRATRITRRVTLSARNYVLRENLAFRVYDMARVGWFLMGKAGRHVPEPLTQRTLSTSERFAVPAVAVRRTDAR